MAKKKRKHFIKLNSKIKSLFNNRAFDEAVADFSDDILFGLVMLLEEEIVDELDRATLIKYLRRVWSEGNFSVRKAIVSFLEDQNLDTKSEKKDKVELILSYLEDVDTTPQEDEHILSKFIEKKLAKITKDKVIKNLSYLRMKRFLDEISKELNIEFIGADSIEFIQTHIVDIDNRDLEINFIHEISFNTTHSKLIEKESQEVLEYLKDLKLQAYAYKEQEIEKSLKSIENIDYLDYKLVTDILLALNEPIKLIENSPIPLKVIKKIIKSFDKTIAISLNRLNYLLSKSFNYIFLDKELELDINITVDRRTLYGSIWTNNIETITTQFKRDKINEIVSFEQYFNTLVSNLEDSIYPLDSKDIDIKEFAINFLLPYIKGTRTLKLKDKIAKRAKFHFNERYKDQKERKKQELLLAKTIRDFKKLFPVARSLNREIIFNVGPTNSGKTYSALQELKSADSGLYLAPLRLLALEGYENLKEDGIVVSLITGEEEIIDEESTHISSTIEMINSDIEVDVCVIDEIQLISDRDRGWAWANALIGAPAKKVILTGSSDALDVVKEIASYLEEPITIVEFERKNPLTLLTKPTHIKNLEPNSAIITFSRKDVLSLKSKISPYFNVSVVYGNLSPEVRREEAKRFREGKTDILIATDAIAMGLNLPIQTVLFAKDNKFDGLQRRLLTSSEILQISGRAGRYGLHENGYVGALEYPTLSTIKDRFNLPLKSIELPISVMASLEHVLLIGEILQTNNLYDILEFFASNMEFDGPFVAANIDSMIEVAQIVDEYQLDLVSKYHLACAPVSINSPYLQRVFNRYLKLLEEDRVVTFLEPKNISKKAVSFTALLNAEDRVKEVSLYLWLSFKFVDKFKDIDLAKQTRDKLNSYIERTLRESNFKKECKKCGKVLDFSYKFSICDKCYNSLRRGTRRRKER